MESDRSLSSLEETVEKNQKREKEENLKGRGELWHVKASVFLQSRELHCTSESHIFQSINQSRKGKKKNEGGGGNQEEEGR